MPCISGLRQSAIEPCARHDVRLGLPHWAKCPSPLFRAKRTPPQLPALLAAHLSAILENSSTRCPGYFCDYCRRVRLHPSAFCTWQQYGIAATDVLDAFGVGAIPQRKSLSRSDGAPLFTKPPERTVRDGALAVAGLRAAAGCGCALLRTSTLEFYRSAAPALDSAQVHGRQPAVPPESQFTLH